MKRGRSKLYFAIVLIFTLLILSVVLRANDTNAQTSIIAESLALNRALAYSVDDGLMGGSLPTSSVTVYGQDMPYGEAVQFVLGRPIDSNTQNYKNRNKVVWLLVLEGKFVEHVPPSADGSIPAKEVIHNQMVIILDGSTGEIMRRMLLSPQIKLSTANLPALQRSTGALPALPTKDLILTEVPYPTLAP